MKGIIDRFEGDYAVIEFEGKTMVDILKRDLPAGLKEGDVIQCTEGAYVIDKLETDRIRKATKTTNVNV
ncbi:DUF3006 domain-containing protein [Desulfosporosinus sp. BICA1-9]|uniref:DUF3006 domain-containing protein n=1 Tax=Desulfosporosinus sp. BICA1-9 TaxID=1531958 RepID=UPI00054B20EA|nr:DUF3006 domain-containing protein [Desulfosporosinus sp. BICA1-9]KJS49936.1 MAG: hypothetical protein VR66_05695 [Peptococcaceae bacterium BRH_c23]KJS81365.1 MAG: hypothetical protein JL57_26700 [Desulfosporosinus sp. BICA1-9]HBW34506.1 DUF3006 domain-containing protein [Desulfosporosinus sp.]